MIAADRNRQFAGVNYSLNFCRQPFTRIVNLGQILQLLARRGVRAWSFYFQIVEVVDFVTELCNSIRKPGDADCRRTQIDASHALTKAKRHTENAHLAPEAGKIRMA